MQADVNISPRDTCFVICPIGAEDSEVRKRSDYLFEDIIQPAAKENGLKAIRADQFTEPGMITTRVIRHILHDRIVVADLTDQNPNVFYEYALRHAFRKPVVQLLIEDQELPFDLQGMSTIPYAVDGKIRNRARKEVESQIRASLKPRHRVFSPVSMAATLKELGRKPQDVNQLILATIEEHFDRFHNRRDQTDEVLAQYAREIDLLRSVKSAGIIDICKSRHDAIQTFARAIEEETREIMVIGSSLKGFLQKEEYREVRERLRFKVERGLVHVKFLLTHPIVADLRGEAENIRPKGIGLEIINSLQVLKEWNDQHKRRHVRLYLGTPTCFGIKTRNKMLINPYPYQAASYDSPCLLMEYLRSDRDGNSGFFFQEFNKAHFAAWDSRLSIPIDDFETAIECLRGMLPKYAADVESLLKRGRNFCWIEAGRSNDFIREEKKHSSNVKQNGAPRSLPIKEKKSRFSPKLVKRAT